MKVKLKKAVQSNNLIDSFIGKVLAAPVNDLAAALANFKWVYDKVRSKPITA